MVLFWATEVIEWPTESEDAAIVCGGLDRLYGVCHTPWVLVHHVQSQLCRLGRSRLIILGAPLAVGLSDNCPIAFSFVGPLADHLSYALSAQCQAYDLMPNRICPKRDRPIAHLPAFNM